MVRVKEKWWETGVALFQDQVFRPGSELRQGLVVAFSLLSARQGASCIYANVPSLTSTCSIAIPKSGGGAKEGKHDARSRCVWIDTHLTLFDCLFLIDCFSQLHSITALSKKQRKGEGTRQGGCTLGGK